MLIASAIIDAVNQLGYLSCTLEEIQESLAPHIEELEVDQVLAVLRQVQSFEPAGVAARDARECLLILQDREPGKIANRARSRTGPVHTWPTLV